MEFRCTRLGTQCWVFFMIAFSELILSLKFGLDLFSRTQLSMMGLWLVCIVVVSCLGVWASHGLSRWSNPAPLTSTESTSTFLNTHSYNLRQRKQK